MSYPITVYTDGSCHTQYRIGAWVALVFVGDEKIVLSGTAADTTHQRMELLAVIRSIQYVRQQYAETRVLHIFSDSQYVTGLPARSEQLAAAQFTTRKGNAIRNEALVEELLLLLQTMQVRLEKVRAHQPVTELVNYNIEADKLSRKLVREAVAALI